MRGFRLVSFLALTATLVLAGCAGGGGAPKSTDAVIIATDEPVPDAATLTVTVVDDAYNPLAGAEVGIIELKLSGSTDEAGQLTFTNLVPGTYQIAAQKLGFEEAGRRVELPPNGEVSQTLTLVPMAPEGQAFFERKGPFDGYFDCRLGIATQTGACVPVAAANANDKSNFRIPMYNDTSFFVGEMKWGQGSYATSQQLRLSFSYEGRPGTHWFCTATSGSPLKWVYSMEDGCLAPAYCGIASSQDTGGSYPEKPTTKLKLIVYVNTPFSCPNAGAPTPNTNNLHPAELALQQKFTIYVTLFQNMQPPEGYTAFSDA